MARQRDDEHPVSSSQNLVNTFVQQLKRKGVSDLQIQSLLEEFSVKLKSGREGNITLAGVQLILTKRGGWSLSLRAPGLPEISVVLKHYDRFELATLMTAIAGRMTVPIGPQDVYDTAGHDCTRAPDSSRATLAGWVQFLITWFPQDDQNEFMMLIWDQDQAMQKKGCHRYWRTLCLLKDLSAGFAICHWLNFVRRITRR
jgi:hypothetical protein